MKEFIKQSVMRMVSSTIKIVIVLAVLLFIIKFFINESGVNTLNRNSPITTYDILEQRQSQLHHEFENPKYKSKEGQLSVKATKMLLCSIVGTECEGQKANSQSDNGGLLGSLASLIVLPIANPPSSGIYETQYALLNSGLVPKTFAAEGIGFAAIKPYRQIWIISRNLSLLLLVILIVILGFLIMFRAKLNPQLVLTVENALPRIVMVLILIPLSFAIAGFLIDLMYVIIAFSIYSFSQLNIGPLNPGNMTNLMNSYIHAPFRVLWPLDISRTFDTFAVGHAFANLFPTTLMRALRGLTTGVVAYYFYRWFGGSQLLGLIQSLLQAIPIVGSGLSAAAQFIITTIIALVIGPFVPGIIIGIALLSSIIILMFKIFFMLIKAYIQILLLLMLSPFIILLDIFPGQGNFSNWIKGLGVELLTFPIVIIISLFSFAIIEFHSQGILPDIYTTHIDSIQGFKPPFLHGLTGNDFGILIGLAMILLIPEIVPKFKEKLGVKDFGFNWQNAFFGGVGLAGGALLSMYTRGAISNLPFLTPVGGAANPAPAFSQERLARAQAARDVLGRITGGGRR